MRKIIFITGTDTGAGKTLLTALLLRHLRRRGVNALAVKPFCSGDRADVKLIQAIQGDVLPAQTVNPWFFSEPVAPLAAMDKKGVYVAMREVVAYIEQTGKYAEILLVEGAGGLMAPLGKDFTALDLIIRLKCPVIVAARDQLGCINHTLLTLFALKTKGIHQVVVTLMEVERPDVSCRDNARILESKALPHRVLSIPFLGRSASQSAQVGRQAAKLSARLNALVEAVLRSERRKK